MRTALFALGAAFALVSTPAAFACDGAKTASNAPAAKMSSDANLAFASFTVDGMSCAVSCPVQIKTALTGLDGVSDVAVNFETKEIQVKFAASEVTPDQMVEAISKLGYKAVQQNSEDAQS